MLWLTGGRRTGSCHGCLFSGLVVAHLDPALGDPVGVVRGSAGLIRRNSATSTTRGTDRNPHASRIDHLPAGTPRPTTGQREEDAPERLTVVKTVLSAIGNLHRRNICLPSFFFQAEDGIRVRNVTGVQTCALPI